MINNIITKMSGYSQMRTYQSLSRKGDASWVNLPDYPTVYRTTGIDSLVDLAQEEKITYQELYQGNTVSRDINGYRDLQQLTNSLSSIGNEKSVSHYKLVVPSTTYSIADHDLPSGIERGALLEPGILWKYGGGNNLCTDIYVPGSGWYVGTMSRNSNGTYGLLVTVTWERVPKREGDYIYFWGSASGQARYTFTSRDACINALYDIVGLAPARGSLTKSRDYWYNVPNNLWNPKAYTWRLIRALPYSGIATKQLMDDVPAIFRYFNTEVRKRHREPAYLATQCCTEAVANLKLNVNSLEGFCDIVDLAKSIASGNFFKEILKVTSTTPEDVWMSYRYVYTTTRSDIDEVLRYTSKARTYTARGGATTDRGRYHVKILFDLDAYEKNQSFVEQYGLMPDLYNLWDLVPMSFVVDWFLGVGDLLEQITNYGYAQRLNVKCVTTSWKWNETETIDIHGFPIKCTFTSYERRVYPSLPPFIPDIGVSASSRTVWKRVVDGVCLLVGFSNGAN